ncbi:unnamed protein product, partial [Ascophyllum nodosum]
VFRTKEAYTVREWMSTTSVHSTSFLRRREPLKRRAIREGSYHPHTVPHPFVSKDKCYLGYAQQADLDCFLQPLSRKRETSKTTVPLVLSSLPMGVINRNSSLVRHGGEGSLVVVEFHEVAVAQRIVR